MPSFKWVNDVIFQSTLYNNTIETEKAFWWLEK